MRVFLRRMWLEYAGYSKEEKAAARPTVREMKAFSAAHRGEVKERGLGLTERIICRAACSDAPLWMYVCRLAGVLRKFVRDLRYKPFR